MRVVDEMRVVKIFIKNKVIRDHSKQRLRGFGFDFSSNKFTILLVGFLILPRTRQSVADFEIFYLGNNSRQRHFICVKNNHNDKGNILKPFFLRDEIERFNQLRSS